MRVAVISDIHSNMVALRAVLDDAGDVDETWCLGDLVGYGPQPNECIDALRSREPRLLCVAGNHDQAVTGQLDSSDFNGDAAAAVLWTQEQITPENLDYLRRLPDRLESSGFLLVHGSPLFPIWEYVVSRSTARENLAALRQNGWPNQCLLGHSHLPLMFIAGRDEKDMPVVEYPDVGTPLALGDRRQLINPGSVGQRRDSNPAASYVILDTDARSMTYQRVSYNVALTQQLMRDSRASSSGRGRLSDRLINRLAHGV